LVLAHVECNQKKKDMLAAEPHLDRWLLRNAEDQGIVEAARAGGIIVDGPATRSVAT
jgi:hypothetical protein